MDVSLNYLQYISSWVTYVDVFPNLFNNIYFASAKVVMVAVEIKLKAISFRRGKNRPHTLCQLSHASGLPGNI